jgi:hypothetical protein
LHPSGVGLGLECRPYADELASGDKDKKTLGSACSVEVIAYLPTIKLQLLGLRINVRFPIDNQVDRAVRLMGKRIDNTADVNRAIGIGVGRKDPSFREQAGSEKDEGDNTSSEFALVARDLVGEGLLDRIPLAKRIAAATGLVVPLRWREMDSNHRSLARKSRFLSRKANCGTERGSQKGCFVCGTDGSNPSPSSRQSVSLPQPLSSVKNPGFPRRCARLA